MDISEVRRYLEAQVQEDSDGGRGDFAMTLDLDLSRCDLDATPSELTGGNGFTSAGLSLCSRKCRFTTPLPQKPECHSELRLLRLC